MKVLNTSYVIRIIASTIFDTDVFHLSLYQYQINMMLGIMSVIVVLCSDNKKQYQPVLATLGIWLLGN